jgi:hypothetical protein
LQRQIRKINEDKEPKVDRRVNSEYNDIAVGYNMLRGEEYLTLEGFNKSVPNLHNVLANRGLEKDRDYVCYTITKDDKGRKLLSDKKKVVLKRLTSREMRLI